MKVIIPPPASARASCRPRRPSPAEMLLVRDRPVIQYIVKRVWRRPPTRRVIRTAAKKSIEEHFLAESRAGVHAPYERGKDKYADAVEHAGNLIVSYVYQDEPGLGHAVHCAEKTATSRSTCCSATSWSPTTTCCPPCRRSSDEHNGASVIAVMPVPDDQVRTLRRHRRLRHLRRWEDRRPGGEARARGCASNLAVFGRHLLSARVMELLAEAKPTVGGEIQLTDALTRRSRKRRCTRLSIRRTASTPAPWKAG